MIRTVEAEVIHDRGYAGNVFQVLVLDEIQVRICDLCGEEIRFDEKIIRGTGREDICTCCVTSGNARKFYAALVQGNILEAEMTFIQAQL